MTKIIDLSVPTEDSPSEPLPVKVSHEAHRQSVEVIKMFFGCAACGPARQGLGWANDSVQMGAHAGTHVDAPWHYSPRLRRKPGPDHRRNAAGVVLRRRRGAGHEAQTARLRGHDRRSTVRAGYASGYTLKPLDIVMIQTGADKYWGKAEYFEAGCGMTRASTIWLIEQGIRVMGIDAWGWDQAVLGHQGGVRPDRRQGPALGRPLCGHRPGVLPHREAGQSRQATAALRLQGGLLPR